MHVLYDHVKIVRITHVKIRTFTISNLYVANEVMMHEDGKGYDQTAQICKPILVDSVHFI